jgi:hypothetical protein
LQIREGLGVDTTQAFLLKWYGHIQGVDLLAQHPADEVGGVGYLICIQLNSQAGFTTFLWWILNKKKPL